MIVVGSDPVAWSHDDFRLSIHEPFPRPPVPWLRSSSTYAKSGVLTYEHVKERSTDRRRDFTPRDPRTPIADVDRYNLLSRSL